MARRKDDQYPAIPRQGSPRSKTNLVTEHLVDEQGITGPKLNDVLVGFKSFVNGLGLSVKLMFSGIGNGSLSYSTTVQGLSNLVGYWRLGEASSPLADTKGLVGLLTVAWTISSTGLLYNEPGALTGDTNGSIKFVRANGQYASGTRYAAGAAGTQGITWEAWVKTTNAAVDGGTTNLAMPVIGDSSNNIWSHFGVHGGKARLTVYSGSAYVALDSTTSVNDGNWHHIVGTLTHDGSNGTKRVYVNGALEATVVTSGSDSPSNGHAMDSIGRSYAGDGKFFDGWIDEVAFYKRALTADEIAANHTAGIMDPGDQSHAIYSLNRSVVLSSKGTADDLGSTAGVRIKSESRPATTAVKIEGAASHTANLLELNVNGGTAVASIAADGSAAINNLTATGKAVVGTNLEVTGDTQLNPQTSQGPLPPNGGFEARPSSTALPYNWDEPVGTFRTDVDWAASDSFEGAKCLEFKNTGVAGKMRSKFYLIAPSDSWDIFTALKLVSGTGNADFGVEWYDRTQTLISTDTLSTAVTSTWTRYRMQKLSPSTTCYAKFFVAKHDTGTLVFRADECRMILNGQPSASYKTAAGQSIANATSTIIDFGTVDFDLFSAVTTGASWHFTVPAGKGGKYLCEACVSPDFTTNTTKTLLEFDLFKNGTHVREMFRSNYVMDGIQGCGGSATIDCADGDTIDFRIFQNCGASKSLTTAGSQYNWCSIIRQGP